MGLFIFVSKFIYDYQMDLIITYGINKINIKINNILIYFWFNRIVKDKSTRRNF